jgi:hypothetical protein
VALLKGLGQVIVGLEDRRVDGQPGVGRDLEGLARLLVIVFKFDRVGPREDVDAASAAAEPMALPGDRYFNPTRRQDVLSQLSASWSNRSSN